MRHKRTAGVDVADLQAVGAARLRVSAAGVGARWGPHPRGGTRPGSGVRLGFVASRLCFHDGFIKTDLRKGVNTHDGNYTT